MCWPASAWPPPDAPPPEPPPPVAPLAPGERLAPGIPVDVARADVAFAAPVADVDRAARIGVLLAPIAAVASTNRSAHIAATWKRSAASRPIARSLPWVGRTT